MKAFYPKTNRKSVTLGENGEGQLPRRGERTDRGIVTGMGGWYSTLSGIEVVLDTCEQNIKCEDCYHWSKERGCTQGIEG